MGQKPTSQLKEIELSYCHHSIFLQKRAFTIEKRQNLMHAGPFSFNRRRRAQNGTGAAAFGGVGREISKIIYNKKF